MITEAFDWKHGVFLASILSSETTAASTGTVGVLRRDPMAMLPFIGYHVGDYFQHWLNIGADANYPRALPKIFYVNWFRRGNDGGFLWPGFGENLRVIDWALRRIDGRADATHTPLGFVPTSDSLDLTGLELDQADLEEALTIQTEEMLDELSLIDQWYATIGGNKLPDDLRQELNWLKVRLSGYPSGAAIAAEHPEMHYTSDRNPTR